MSIVTSEELLEEWDWKSGRPTGRSVTRAESYRRGIPHEGVHLWIVRGSGECELLFQHRSKDKALFPDCLDITVGGHVPFGLTGNKVQKEAMEELGICPQDDELSDLGYLRFDEETEDYHHREFQHVYMMRDDRSLDRYRFTDGEVVGIYAVPVDYFQSLYERDSALTVSGFDGRASVLREISRKDFHPLIFIEKMRYYMNIIIRGARELSESGQTAVRMSDEVEL